METKSFLHKHYLLLDHDHFDKQSEAICDKCNQPIGRYGWTYSCETCNYNFWLHRDCAENQLPPQISHPLHPQHQLTLSFAVSHFICAKCFTLSRGHRYGCDDCRYEVDLLCASDTKESQKSDAQPEPEINRKRVIPHFVHRDGLTGPFNYRKVKKEHQECRWCEKNSSGKIYGCFDCWEEFYIHESCLNNIPTKISSHPFHPFHPLYLQPVNHVSKPFCNVCKDDIVGHAYRCQKCDFCLHVLCSKLKPTLKHEIHEHGLTFFRIKFKSSRVTFQCHICDKDIAPKYSDNIFYRCVQCDFNFHLTCLEIPPSIKHGYHRHALTLIQGFREDDSGEYYCDICEEERNLRDPVYCCEKCTYIAHVQCVLNKVYSKDSIPESLEQEDTEKGNAESQSHDPKRQIAHFTHQHPLSYYEVTAEDGNLVCKACNSEIYGEAYGCWSCKFYLDNTCAKLTYELLHPLHPQHPLQLFDKSDYVLCDECRDMSVGFSYICYLCDFKLDLKCATLTTPSNESQRRNKMVRELKLMCPFKNDHEIGFFNFRHEPIEDLWCSICIFPLSGPTYICVSCHYSVHESCLGLPSEIVLHLLHPQHPLNPIANQNPYKSCLACRCTLDERDIVYDCQHCNKFKVHLPCANSLRRALKSNSHDHPLFYFGTECQPIFARKNRMAWWHNYCHGCYRCKKSLSDDQPFFRCIACDINFDLECALVPRFIKSKCHIHTLTLVDSFVEDDSGEYYCDVCEEERNPKHHVYICEECQGLFVAHIECVLNKMVEEIAAAD